jgi:hypothetical protein
MRSEARTDRVITEFSSTPSVDARPVSQVNPCGRVEVPLVDACTVLAGGLRPELPPDVLGPLQDVARWMEDFLNRPHPMLGRSGEVCPWTKRTIELGKLLLAPIASRDAAEVDDIVLSLLERFWSLEPTRGADAAFRSIVAVFHRLEPETAAPFVVATHQRLKPSFLDRGLMLGEFYPTNPKPGLRNPNFRPLRSPVPLLVIRQMVEPDVEFLLDRDEFIAAYLRTHRGRGRDRLLRVLEQRPSSVSPERVPVLLELADEYRDSIPPSRRSSPYASR